MVVGVVDSNSRVRPVRTVPFLSVATDVIGCVLFGFTTTLGLLPEIPGTLNAILVGGHVEKNPAELPAFEIFAVITVDPGCCAVATPFWSLVTTGCTKIGSGLLLAPSPLAITYTVPLLLVGLQVVKSGMPPPVFRFQVPAHSLPVVGSTSAMVKSGVPLARKVP